jgi:hypothetical protein
MPARYTPGQASQFKVIWEAIRQYPGDLESVCAALGADGSILAHYHWDQALLLTWLRSPPYQAWKAERDEFMQLASAQSAQEVTLKSVTQGGVTRAQSYAARLANMPTYNQSAKARLQAAHPPAPPPQMASEHRNLLNSLKVGDGDKDPH